MVPETRSAAAFALFSNFLQGKQSEW